ncbi:MAG: hypothetical protein A2X23_08400 [Chloroflexi bacterium GWC2_73_18]|nr:MAG: hypothetical protein A2X23_08400 [Chloroflexi bacterium GWC2_73_18]
MATSRSLGARSLTTRSPMRTVPAVTSSSPAIMRRAVVLPQPLGPTSTRNSSFSMASERSLTAITSPKRLVTRSKVTVAISSSSIRRSPDAGPVGRFAGHPSRAART